jgi:hypothetical protein
MSVTFDYSSNTAVIKNPRYPENNPELPRQELGKSSGGAHRVFIRGTAGKTMKLSFKRLDDTDKGNFQTWIEDQANFFENTFTYTDPHAVDHTSMRFVDFGNMFSRIQGTNRWDITVTLERDEGL